MTGYFRSLYYRSLLSPALSLFSLHLLQVLDLFHLFSFISLPYLFQINTAIFYIYHLIQFPNFWGGEYQ